MGIFSLGSNVLGGSSTNLYGQPYAQDLYKTPAPTSTPSYSQPAATAYSAPQTASSAGTPSAGWRPGGLAAGPLQYLPKASTPAAPASPSSPSPSSSPSYTPYSSPYSAPSSAPSGGGGGGGGGGSFSFNNTYQAPQLAAMPQMDFSGLVSGFGDLLSQSQKGDIPGNVPLSTQKDTMQLQGLREAAAGWNELTGPGSSNPALGNRILPDESKKLAALQSARVY